ncbi:MAG TPA: acetolactate synthase small subunit [Candidatus Bathyarchaeia archaeon]|nr:acetolactate synthase small subunit [Candidatus Bathyarchaeia archaeon]
MSQDTQLRIISALVEDKPGVLYRITNLIRRKSFNIESIAVGKAETPGLSRMTFTMVSDYSRFDQVMKNIDALIDVRGVEPLDLRNAAVRELALVKLSPGAPATRPEIINYIETFRGNIVDVSPDTLTVEVSGDPDKINAFIKLAKNYGLTQVARTGAVALSREMTLAE